MLLPCTDNLLTVLDVTKNVLLVTFWCCINKLTALDVTQNTNLQALWCYDNKLTDLDLSNNTQPKVLLCYKNQITTLDLSNTKITYRSDIHGVNCDDKVEIIFPATNTTVAPQTFSSAPSNNRGEADKNEELIIVASIPEFQVEYSDEYIFGVSLDKEILEESQLILLNNSEDLNAVFLNDDNEIIEMPVFDTLGKNLKVAANLEAGKTYAPGEKNKK